MNKLINLVVFVIVVGVLWWALGQVLAALALPALFATLATVAFVVLAVIMAADFLMNGTWVWKRP